MTPAPGRPDLTRLQNSGGRFHDAPVQYWVERNGLRRRGLGFGNWHGRERFGQQHLHPLLTLPCCPSCLHPGMLTGSCSHDRIQQFPPDLPEFVALKSSGSPLRRCASFDQCRQFFGCRSCLACGAERPESREAAAIAGRRRTPAGSWRRLCRRGRRGGRPEKGE